MKNQLSKVDEEEDWVRVEKKQLPGQLRQVVSVLHQLKAFLVEKETFTSSEAKRKVSHARPVFFVKW